MIHPTPCALQTPQERFLGAFQFDLTEGLLVPQLLDGTIVSRPIRDSFDGEAHKLAIQHIATPLPTDAKDYPRPMGHYQGQPAYLVFPPEKNADLSKVRLRFDVGSSDPDTSLAVIQSPIYSTAEGHGVSPALKWRAPTHPDGVSVSQSTDAPFDDRELYNNLEVGGRIQFFDRAHPLDASYASEPPIARAIRHSIAVYLSLYPEGAPVPDLKISPKSDRVEDGYPPSVINPRDDKGVEDLINRLRVLKRVDPSVWFDVVQIGPRGNGASFFALTPSDILMLIVAKRDGATADLTLLRGLFETAQREIIQANPV